MKFLKKAIVRIPLLIVVIIVALVLSSNFLISKIGRYYVNNHGKELIGRKVNIEDISVNLFTGTLGVDSLTIYEKDDKSSFFHFDQLETNLEISKLFSGLYSLEYLHLNGIKLDVTQRDSIFNFSDIIDFFSSDTTAEEPKKEDSSIPLIINDINIANSFVRYRDLVVKSDFKLEDFSLNIPGIDLSKLDASVGVNLQFVDGGSLQTSVLYNDKEKTYDVTLNLKDFNIKSVLPYVQQYVNAGKLDGLLTTDLHIVGDLYHIMEFKVKGDVIGKELSLLDKSNELIFASDSITVGIKDLDLTGNSYSLSEFSLVGPKTQYVLDKDSVDNFSKFLQVGSTSSEFSSSEPSAKDSTDSAKLKLFIDHMSVTNGEVKYVDNTLKVQPFKYNVTNIDVKSNEFDLNSSNRIVAGATLMNQGDARVTYDGKIDDLSNINLMLQLKNVGISDFSPYSLQMFAYPLKKGNMSISSQTIIKNNELNGVNTVSIYKPAVEKKRKDLDPEMNVPLKLGIYCLTDKKGKCELDLPVKGNIESPEFSYKKALFKVLGQLLVKVATSPFRMFGGSDEDSDVIPFTELLSDISHEEYERFDTLVSLVNQKPEMTVSLAMQISKDKANREVAEASLLREYYVSKHPEKAETRLDLFDRSELKSLDIKSDNIGKFADQQLQAAGITVAANSSNSDKAVALYGGDKASPMIERLETMRINQVNKYFENMGVGSKIKCALDPENEDNSKFQYKVTLAVDD